MNLDELLREKLIANGPFEDVAPLAQAIKFVLRRGKNWDALPPESKEALEQAASRIAIILTGDATNHDHWDKLAMYARLRGEALGDKKLEADVGRLGLERTAPTLRTYPLGGPRSPQPRDDA